MHPHRAQVFLNRELLASKPTDAELKALSLGAVGSSSLKSCLHEDAASYIYSAFWSLGDAIRSIDKNLSTWPMVKLYYSAFYSARCVLATEGKCIFYSGKKAFYTESVAGFMPLRFEGATHKVVLHAFQQRGSEKLFLSQDIESLNPMDWLMERREEANYKDARFIEPEVSDYFKKAVEAGIRSSTQEYLGPDGMFLMFDPDHAALAYPLRLCVRSLEICKQMGIWRLSRDQASNLKKLFADQDGPLASICNLLDS